MTKRTFALPALLAVSALPAAAQAQAAGPDVTALTSAVDYSTIAPAILAVGALGIGILLAFTAVKYIRRGVRNA